MLRSAALVGSAFLLLSPVPGVSAQTSEVPEPFPHVVVATLDTGTNPLHPSWRREQPYHPSTFIPGYPASAEAIQLDFQDTFEDTLEGSKPALSTLKEKSFPYWFPGTNLIGTWSAPTDAIPIFDTRAQAGATHSHGASASSQIAGLDLGMAPDAFLVIVDRTLNNAAGGSTNADVYRTNGEALRWAADQPWIDIIHTNIQNVVPLAGNQVPYEPGYHDAVEYALSKGKLVISAGGNWYAEPTETSPHAGPSGVLAAGANDNCGYTDYSNPDPHVVMDGYGTVAAAPNGFGTATFSGTSSASPRITGYSAQLLLEIRRRFGYTDGMVDGALMVLPPAQTPAEGPLSDGRLTADELHEVIRKTADPNPHASMWDGTQSICVPQPADLPFSFYPKMGYGEVSEHTLPDALGVALGESPIPERPIEDAFYSGSEAARHAFWD
ncbi:MAG: S8 family serine peptidase [Actinomycetota bacterium]